MISEGGWDKSLSTLDILGMIIHEVEFLLNILAKQSQWQDFEHIFQLNELLEKHMKTMPCFRMNSARKRSVKAGWWIRENHPQRIPCPISFRFHTLHVLWHWTPMPHFWHSNPRFGDKINKINGRLRHFDGIILSFLHPYLWSSQF